MKTLPLVSAAITILLPFLLQKTGLSEKYGFKMKMLCAFMYLLTGGLSALAVNTATAYSLMILGALCSGALGDFFLEYKEKKLFSAGVIFFALGHIAYISTFLFSGTYRAVDSIAAVSLATVLINALIIIFAKAKLKLNGKKKLLLAYAPVLVLACICAVSSGLIAFRQGNASYGLCLTSGGVLFFASDIMIGIGKGGIKRPRFLHNAVSYTYFAAQALFALSIYFQ